VSETEADLKHFLKKGSTTPEEVQKLREAVEKAQKPVETLRQKYVDRYYLLAKHVHVLKRFDESHADTHYAQHSSDRLASTVLLMEMRTDLCKQEPVKAMCEKLTRRIVGGGGA
jgi:multidrug resistance efflux pump